TAAAGSDTIGGTRHGDECPAGPCLAPWCGASGTSRKVRDAVDIQRLGVVGSGLMGSGIAQVAATSGIEVVVVDIDDARVDAGLSGIRRRLEREAERGRISKPDAESALRRLSGSDDLEPLPALRS